MSDRETIDKYFDCNWGCGCPKRHCPDDKPCQRCRIADLEARVREVESDRERYKAAMDRDLDAYESMRAELAAARVTIGDFIRNVTADPDATLNWSDVPAILDSIGRAMGDYRDSAANAENGLAETVEVIDSIVKSWNSVNKANDGCLGCHFMRVPVKRAAALVARHQAQQ